MFYGSTKQVSVEHFNELVSEIRTNFSACYDYINDAYEVISGTKKEGD